MIRKILEKVFITKKYTQRKTSNTLKTDKFELPDNTKIGKLFSNYELFSLDQANFSSDTSQILILEYPIPRASLPPSSSLSISPWPTKTPLQRNPQCVLHRFPYFFLPHSTTRNNYWIYQTICQAKPIKFIIKLYTNHNTLLIKHATY